MTNLAHRFRNGFTMLRHAQRVAARSFLRTQTFAAFSTGAPDIKKVGVIGLGLMGHGIAQTAASSGFEVVGLETEASFLDRGMGLIEKSLQKIGARAVKKEKMPQAEADADFAEQFGRIEGTTESRPARAVGCRCGRAKRRSAPYRSSHSRR